MPGPVRPVHLMGLGRARLRNVDRRAGRASRGPPYQQCLSSQFEPHLETINHMATSQAWPLINSFYELLFCMHYRMRSTWTDGFVDQFFSLLDLLRDSVVRGDGQHSRIWSPSSDGSLFSGFLLFVYLFRILLR